MSKESSDGCCNTEDCPASKSYCWDDSSNKFPPIRTVFLISTFLFYLLDVGLDGYVAYEHYLASEEGTDRYARYYFRATIFFIAAPLLVINIISWVLYTWCWVFNKESMIGRYLRKKCLFDGQPLWVEGDPDTDYHDGRKQYSEVPVEDIKMLSWPGYHIDRKHKRKVENLGRKDQETSFTTTKPNDSSNNLVTGNTRGSASSTIPILDTSGGTCTDEQDSGIPNSGGEDYPDVHLKFDALDDIKDREYFLVTVLHIFMLGFIYRVARLLFKRKHDTLSFDRYRDVSFLRLMEAFLESAPQLVLQLYIVVVREEARLVYKVITPISIVVSMASLALAVGDYISAAKDQTHYDLQVRRQENPSLPSRPRLSWTAYFIIIFWHFCMIMGRGTAFALFASVHGIYVFVIVGVHYAVMLYWMYKQHAHVFVKKTTDYFNPGTHVCGNYGIEFIIAAFNTFFHFKIKDSEYGSWESLVPFYTLTFIENTIMVLLWFFGRDLSVSIWYEYPALAAVFGTFIVGLMLMIIYYAWCQPKQRRDALDYPTMTCTLSRAYTHNRGERSRPFKREPRRGSTSSALRLTERRIS